MSEEDPEACAEPEEPKAGPPPEKTSDCYRVSEDLPARFNNPAWFRGYRTKEPPSVYRTSNQVYGSRAPTVHEMPDVCSRHQSRFPYDHPLQETWEVLGPERRDG